MTAAGGKRDEIMKFLFCRNPDANRVQFGNRGCKNILPGAPNMRIIYFRGRKCRIIPHWAAKMNNWLLSFHGRRFRMKKHKTVPAEQICFYRLTDR